MSGWGIVWSILGIIVFFVFVEVIIKGGCYCFFLYMCFEKLEILDMLLDEFGIEVIDKEKFNVIIVCNCV